MSNQQQPIGVFDSGLGGLTVLKVLATRFPQESFVYLGDTARLPYGTKSAETIRKYTEQNLQFLKNQNVKAMVIACNSASSTFPENSFHDLPVFTVIDPGAKAALNLSQGRIGILGTRATISSKVYEKSLRKNYFGSTPLEVSSVAAPLFVPLAEEGWIDDPITNLIAYRYCQPLIQAGVDTVIMGCTHYPILKAALKKSLGNSVQLVDSGEAVAEELAGAFKSGLIRASEVSRGEIQILSTDLSPQFERMARQLMMPLVPDSIEICDLI